MERSFQNQQRRRTAGGVFFYLLRGDPKFPKKIVDKIFAVDVQNQRVGKKRAHKEKRLKTMEKLEEKLVEEHQKLIEQGLLVVIKSYKFCNKNLLFFNKV